MKFERLRFEILLGTQKDFTLLRVAVSQIEVDD